jgi:hypothetical protein
VVSRRHDGTEAPDLFIVHVDIDLVHSTASRILGCTGEGIIALSLMMCVATFYLLGLVEELRIESAPT